MIDDLQRMAIGWTLGLGAGYVILVVMLNHFMISGNEKMMRLFFYLLAASVPVGIISAARSLARVHRGIPQDDLREGTIPILWGIFIAACIYAASLITQ